MARMARSFTQIRRLFSAYPHGCPRNQIAAVNVPEIGMDRFKSTDADGFRAGVQGTKPHADPSFFVPAVIDALRSDCRYRKLVSLVPGEADAACARHVAKHGGLVLTSDSDLLVYDLEAGKVAFFRDLHRGTGSSIMCFSFSPGLISQRLGLIPSTGILRVAYELQRAPHATLAQISRFCEQPLAKDSGYLELYEQYQTNEDNYCPLHPDLVPELSALDPRLSELVVQLYNPRYYHDVARIFLPVLIENLDRGSAWQQSTPIRRLAYTLLAMDSVRPTVSMLEYRRVQTVTQKGRLVETAPTAEAWQYIIEVLGVMERMKGLTCLRGRYYWPLVSLALEMGECQRQGKQSHAWHMFQQRYKRSVAYSSKLTWDVAHLFAQIQAGLYSLRMLRQVLSIVYHSVAKHDLPPNTQELCAAMLDFPSLCSFPDIDATLNLLLESGEVGFVREFGQLMRLPSVSELGVGIKVAPGGAMEEDIRKLAAKPNMTNKANMFGPLSLH